MDSLANGVLWDRYVYPDAPGHRAVSTSIQAADAIAPKLGRLQGLVLASIRGQGPRGFTADELADDCEMDRWSIQPRTTELRRKGLIVDSGLRRLNASGRSAIVWVTPENKRDSGNEAQL